MVCDCHELIMPASSDTTTNLVGVGDSLDRSLAGHAAGDLAGDLLCG